MATFVTYTLAAVLVLGVLIFVHELGRGRGGVRGARAFGSRGGRGADARFACRKSRAPAERPGPRGRGTADRELGRARAEDRGQPGKADGPHGRERRPAFADH